MDLFEAEDNFVKNAPLADRMRPRRLEDFVGQEHLLGSFAGADGQKKILRQLIEQDAVPSIILWGPPGTGKTTLARIIAEMTKSFFVSLSAVTAGVSQLKEIVKEAEDRRKFHKTKTILFIDEIHRWNKAQQDALLPYVEKGTVVLIGATTENPSFEVNSALLSRSRVFVLEQLAEEDIFKILKRAVKDKDRGLGKDKIKIKDSVLKYLVSFSNGDARVALNALEVAVSVLLNSDTSKTAATQGSDVSKQVSQSSMELSKEIIREALQKSSYLYDKGGEQHYNIISALHKSLRGSDADAALYWLTRMFEAGEDPLYIARRLVRFASEDIGLANSRALEQAVAGYQACQFIGRPECDVILAQVVVYLAKCKKSNELYRALGEVKQDVKNTMDEPVPIHLRNLPRLPGGKAGAPTKLMKELGYGKDYKYSPDFEYKEDQDYLPKKLRRKKWLKE